MTTLLPANRTETEIAIEANVESRLRQVPINIRYNKQPRNIDDALLPLLAIEFSVDNWDNDLSNADKRELVAASIEQHRFKATKWAVDAAVHAIDPLARVEERGDSLTFPILMVDGLSFSNDLDPNTVKISARGSSVNEIKRIKRAVYTSKPLHVAVIFAIKQSLLSMFSLSASASVKSRHIINGSIL